MHRVRQTMKLAVAVALLSPSIQAQQAQPAVITGRVTDRATQQPVPNAQVVIVGTTRGTLTNDDGRYRIAGIPPGTVQVRALRIGYEAATQSVPVTAGGTATADFTLATAAINLDQVVVTATGETQRRRESGAITNTIDVDSLALAPISNFSQVLTGRAPGVNVTLGTGTIGAGNRVRIRGANSVSLANDPLLIVDGVRVDNDPSAMPGINVGQQEPSRFDDINLEDIENIEVIKGPAASALYGTAAANGVIQITTKRGRPGKAQWNSFAEVGEQTEFTDFPFNYRQIGDLTTPRPDGTTRTTNCSIDNRTRGVCTPRVDSLAAYTPLRSDAAPFRDGWRQTYGLSVAGGSENTTYYIASDYEREQGVYEANTLRKINLRANVRGQVRDNLDVTVTAGYLTSQLRLPQNDNNVLGLISGGLLGSAFDNPVNRGYILLTPDQSQSIRTRQDVERLVGSLNSNWQPLSWLRWVGTAGLDVLNRYDHDLLLPNRILALGRGGGYRQSERYQNFVYTANTGFTGTASVTPDLSSSTSVGVQYVREVLRSTEAFGQNLLPGTSSLQGVTSLFAVDEDNTDNITFGAYVQEQLAWRDRLFLTAAVRGDDNSAFGEDFGLVYYPAGSLSWVIGEESFFPQLSWLNSLRLRTAYGESGQRPTFRSAVTFFSPVSVAVNGADVPGVTIGGTGNAELKPEKSRELEVGFDAGLFNERVAVEVTYYHKTTSDALISRNLPGSLGASASRFENIGEIRNSGLEVLLNARLLERGAFKWDVTLTGATNDNEIVELGEGVEPITLNASTQVHKEGLPAGAYYMVPYTFSDRNGDGLISRGNCPGQTTLPGGPACEIELGEEPVFLGRVLPSRTASLVSNVTLFNYARISALLDYRGGHKLLNRTERFRCAFAQNCRGLQDDTAPLADQAAAIASLLGTDAGFLSDAEFVKLREVALTLSAPRRWASRLGVSGLSLTLAGRNLATWTNYSGFDPEANEFGATTNFSTSDFLTQPQLRSYTARLNLSW
ncbi:MAG: SusC/RagA family TonB-linked outer membrane protein [Gemmatimonadaceae bacterium]